MAYQILVITTKYLARYMDDIFSVHSEDVVYRIVEYRHFLEIGALYLAHEDWADGVMTTGIVVETALRREVKGTLKPILSLGTDNENFYKIPLILLIENRGLDPERIIFDVFVGVSPNASVLELIQNKCVNDMFPYFEKWLAEASVEELYEIEEKTVRQIQKLWEEKKIDMVICRYSSIVEELKELKIPCVFATASDEYAHQCVEHLIAMIKLDKITARLPACILVTPIKRSEELWNEYQELNIQKALMDFAKVHDLKFLIQKSHDGLLVITEKTVVSYLTENFQNSIISGYLKDYADFDLIVSYGIGHTVKEALENAEFACKAARGTGETFLVNEGKRLTGPLEKGKTVLTTDMINPQMQAIAKCASLSTVMIQRLNRLLCLLDKREITSRELAEHFSITVREANRILKNLETADFASVILQKSEHLRGRPAKIYHINWEI